MNIKDSYIYRHDNKAVYSLVYSPQRDKGRLNINSALGYYLGYKKRLGRLCHAWGVPGACTTC